MEENVIVNEPLITVRKSNHRFRFFVEENGVVTFTLDGENTKFSVKEVANGKVVFKESIELYIEDDVEFLDGLSLSDLDFATLKGKQNEALALFKKINDKVKEWSLDGKSKKELLAMVDKWQKKTSSRKKTVTVNVGGKEKKKTVKEKYAVHIFTVGSEQLRMIERYIDGETVINPDYKIYSHFPKAGGIGMKEGELMVWKYYYEKESPSEIDPTRKQGFWETAREMRYTERVCFEIISRYGFGEALETKK